MLCSFVVLKKTTFLCYIAYFLIYINFVFERKSTRQKYIQIKRARDLHPAPFSHFVLPVGRQPYFTGVCSNVATRKS